MNEYGFDYLNYITSIPKSMEYTQKSQSYMDQTDKPYMDKNYMNSAHKSYTNQSYHVDKSGKSYEHLSKKLNMNLMPNSQMKVDMMANSQVLDPTQGWMKGNLFTNLYEPYKNYKVAELDPKNEKETLLYQVMQYNFALVELNLYLDMHPNDTAMLNLYQKYLMIEKEMVDKYEKMYGPLSLESDNLGKNTWKWDNSPWPWEGV